MQIWNKLKGEKTHKKGLPEQSCPLFFIRLSFFSKEQSAA